MLQGSCNGAAARPNIGRARRSARPEFVAFGGNGFHEQLRLGAGNQDGRGDLKGQAVEFLFPGDILRGLSRRLPAHGFFPGGRMLRRERITQGHQILGPAHIQHMPQQQLGIGLWFMHPSRC
ncbi:hypothetical protein D3C72_832990 [compost metagenome]